MNAFASAAHVDDRHPAVSVVVPCRNEAAHIAAAVTGLFASVAPPGGFEVIVADGMSDDGTRDVLRLLMDNRANGAQNHGASLRLIDNPHLIVSTGLNTAIRAARGEIIIRLDAHTEFAPDYMRECVATLQSTGADNVGGPWVAKGDTFVSRAVAAAFQSSFAVGGARGHDPQHEGEVDTVYLGCWRREVFDRFGYFDEELVRNQDDEHNLRITRGRGKIYQSPKIKSWYRPRGSLGALFKQYMQYGYWKVRVIQKHKLPASWRHLVPGAFVLTLSVLFLFSIFGFLLSDFAPQLSYLRIPISRFSFQLSAFSFALLTALGSYLFAVALASLITAARTEWKLFWILPLVFPCYHFGYGCGFLRGILDFVLLRRSASPAFSKLTRGPSAAKPVSTDT